MTRVNSPADAPEPDVGEGADDSSATRSVYRYAIVALSLTAILLGAVQALHWWRLRGFTDVAPICRIQTTSRVVALTFDDGPDRAYTPTILELLSASDARATFFVIGERALEHSDLVAEIAGSGNELGNHTWSHPHLQALSEADALNEIRRGSVAFAPSQSALLFRAPYGEIRPDTLAGARRQGLTPVHWSIALDHFLGEMDLSPRDAAIAIVETVSPGDIILAHDARDGGLDRDRAVAALDLLLPLLRSNGFDVVTMSSLLAAGEPVLAVPRPWFWQNGFTCPTG